MSAPSPTTDLSIGARLTGYLRERFTWRTSTEARPRYLGIFAMPTPDYMGAAAPLPSVPRFGVTVGSSQFDSDLPDEFLAPATPDGGDGSIDPGDLDMTSPTFDVFRVPITRAADLSTFVRRDAALDARPLLPLRTATT